MNNSDELCGIQFGFTGGVKSPLYQTALGNDPKHELKTIKIDTKKVIRQVSMKVWNGYAIKGLRLTDNEGEHMINLDWAGVGQWSHDDIPEGQEIIGLKCNLSSYPSAIPRLGLLLWVPLITNQNENICRSSW